uniref:Large ribosomal subunit protein uL22c n=1 Tax=Cyathodium smaragdinum TaxID=2846787 RepID=A0A8F2XVG5_9MARC|nr:ribosomal protein L22 [Cyathodium smaragdinum]
MKTNTSDPKICAITRHVHMSPYKVRRAINQIRGRSYEEALIILEFMPYRACNPILQLLSSAAANANYTFGLKKTNLLIHEIQVNKGTFFKRFQPRAQGRGYPIHKPTCHIMIVLKTIV